MISMVLMGTMKTPCVLPGQRSKPCYGCHAYIHLSAGSKPLYWLKVVSFMTKVAFRLWETDEEVFISTATFALC